MSSIFLLLSRPTTPGRAWIGTALQMKYGGGGIWMGWETVLWPTEHNNTPAMDPGCVWGLEVATALQTEQRQSDYMQLQSKKVYNKGETVCMLPPKIFGISFLLSLQHI